MYVKKGLVFDKHSGAIIGYAEVGDVTNLLDTLEAQVDNPEGQMRPLAKCMLVFMVRGVFTSLRYPYVQFSAVSTKGASLFPLLRKVLARLAWLGMTVVSVVCDGASDNRRMFSMHDSNDKMVYKIPNLYTKKKIQFFSSLILAIYLKLLETVLLEENCG